jgi:hypothetical protein
MGQRAKVVAIAAGMLTAAGGASAAAPALADEQTVASEYVVLYDADASAADARAAIRRAGGRVVSENAEVGVATVRAGSAGFARRVARSAAIEGASADRSIAQAPQEDPKADDVEGTAGPGDWHGRRPTPPPTTGDPLSGLQWDMAATSWWGSSTPASTRRIPTSRRTWTSA